ncbi:MAG: winged helix-turn-helix domain-containing protein [Candidatus Eisenbacteria bacterium]
MTKQHPASQIDATAEIRDFEVLASVDAVKALADATRLQMLEVLQKAPETGSSLARLLGIPANRAHYHLGRLVDAGLVKEIGPERDQKTEERYFVATARHLLVDPGLTGITGGAIASVRSSIEAAFLEWRRSQVLALDWGDLASSIVDRSLAVRPTDEVLIVFMPGSLELAEVLFLEVEAAGACAHLRPWSRNVILREAERRRPVSGASSGGRSGDGAAGAGYLPADLDARITAVVFLTSSMVQGAPPSPEQREGLPYLMEAVSDWKKSLSSRGIRYLTVGLPHRAEFAHGELSSEAAIDLFWQCVTVEPEQLRPTGELLEGSLRESPQLLITSRDGSELRVEIDPAHLTTDDGVIREEDVRRGRCVRSLPAGALVALPRPASGEGEFLADYTFASGGHVADVRVTLRDGRIVALDAPHDADLVRGRLERESGDPDLLSAISIGLNPAGSAVTGRPELDSVLHGVVTLDFGNNELWGGNVRSTFNLSLPSHGATVRAGTRTLVARGRLVAGKHRTE